MTASVGSTSQPVWPQIVTWLLVIIGWVVVHFLGEARERRKEVRSELDEIFAELREIETAACSLHCAEAFSGIDGRHVLVSLESAERRILRLRLYDDHEFSRAIIALRQAISLENFSVGEFVKQDGDSPILDEISWTTGELIDALDSGYRMRYPERFPYYTKRAFFLTGNS
ncbi:hypothetical protein [Ralstonia pseudosolanacearum]|uniref:hypothetical protein n=1 Tax=Ralstonia pseudosolanacearum TaxID=1310165 RepID=UPI003CF9202B